MRTHWIKVSGGLFGIILIILMVFANTLGLESFSTWGVRRTLLLLAGITLLASALFYKEDNLIGKTIHASNGRFSIALSGLIFAILLVYLWYSSDGLWKTLTNETNYYDLQASAFAKGQLALDVRPDAALLAFQDESLYEPSNREGIPMLWDATLYKGKYYLYWGPAPALFLTPLKWIYSTDLGDKLLSLLFLTGTFLFLTLTLLSLWRDHFPHVPRWAVISAVAFAGLVNPMPYILVEGRIYEAAIAAAQFFLIGGFYFLLPAFDRPNELRLAMAGLFFTLAAGSRTTLIPAIGVLSVILLLWVLQTQRGRMISLVLSFALPLMIGGIGYGWYNYARFGSVTEFGLRYQLTSYNLYESLDETFSLEYIAPNLYKTLLNPLEKRDAFPYLFPTRWSGPGWLAEGHPSFYLAYAEGITGILVSSPFVLFALLPLYRPRREMKWHLLALGLSFFATLVTLQAFFFIAMRYLLDAIPTLTLLTVAGFWHGFKRFKNNKIHAAIGILWLAHTIIISLVISISGNLEAFKILNPDLLKQMAWLFKMPFK